MKTFLLAVQLAVLCLWTVSTTDASAQASYFSQARPGVYGRTSTTTNNVRRADARRTSTQRIGARLPMAGLGNTSIAPAVRGGGLPPTRMDSFILNAGGRANQIYGDEGTVSLPPYYEFTKEHRINEGIVADRDAGLTTGHGSYLPDAWGNDEFLGAEWSQSGANDGNRQNFNQQIPYAVRRAPRYTTHLYRDGRFVNLERNEENENLDQDQDHIHR